MERSNGECSVSQVRMQCFKMANASVSEMYDFTPTDACDFYCVMGRRLFTHTHCSTTIIIFFLIIFFFSFSMVRFLRIPIVSSRSDLYFV